MPPICILRPDVMRVSGGGASMSPDKADTGPECLYFWLSRIGARTCKIATSQCRASPFLGKEAYLRPQTEVHVLPPEDKSRQVSAPDYYWIWL